MRLSVNEKELNWLEPFSLTGTCPLCGVKGLQLTDNMWIPLHTKKEGSCQHWSTFSQGPQDLCPSQLHTQAVEDGGVSVELHFLWLADKALMQRRKSMDEEGHPERCEGCSDCFPLSLRAQASTSCYNDLAYRWSRPNKDPLVSWSDLSAGVSLWRDREPFYLKTMDSNPRIQFEQYVRHRQSCSPSPKRATLRLLERMLETGLVETTTFTSEASTLNRLRRHGYVRKVVDHKKCRYFVHTPFGLFILGKYLLGFDKIVSSVERLRSQLSPEIQVYA